MKLRSELVEIGGVNCHPNIPNFVAKIDKKKKTVKPTPFLQKLCVKLGSRVMLTINLDVEDSLCNGSIGTLEKILRSKATKEVFILLVKFDNENSGRELRRQHPQLANKFPGCTPIRKEIHKYSTAEKSRGVKTNVAVMEILFK